MDESNLEDDGLFNSKERTKLAEKREVTLKEGLFAHVNDP